MSSKADLAMAANELSRAAAPLWGNFLLALGAYASSVKDECIQSPIDTLPVAQGRAQQADQLLTLLTRCREDALKVTTNRKK